MEKDTRNIKWGSQIPKLFYCDQPYVVVTDAGHWLCVMTTGHAEEGKRGQHIVSAISYDRGHNWSELTAIEPADGPEASWAMPYKTSYGRIYVFYTYNENNLREMISDEGYSRNRVDTLGAFMYRYSDDHGLTWSRDRHRVPIREMMIDRNNPYGGKVQFFWGVGKPMLHRSAVFMGVAKVGRFGDGFMACSEGVFLRSDNLDTERNPLQLQWLTLPDGDHGIAAPLGPIADEHNLTGLSDGSLFCTFRTVAGHSGQAYSRDMGHTWTEPTFMEYEPGGRLFKHPRAANFVRKLSNGKYIYWFHNHGMDRIDRPSTAYKDRNPAWLSGGIERDGYIYWSQPEILLYDDDPDIRISYPDFVEDGDGLYITETQKEIARVHEVDWSLLHGMWNQREQRKLTESGLAVRWFVESGEANARMPQLPSLQEGNGITIDFWVRGQALMNADGACLFDSRDASGIGIAVWAGEDRRIHLQCGNGKAVSAWPSDAHSWQADRWHHIAIILEGGPKLILFVIDGVLCDGGDERQFGWGRIHPGIQEVTGALQAQLNPAALGELRVYVRPLRVSECVANYQAGSRLPQV